MKKLDLTKPLQTLNGLPVELIFMNGRSPYRLIGYIGDNCYVSSWDENGHRDRFVNEPNDLINVPEKKRSGRVSIVILKDGTPCISGCVIENKTDVRGISPGIESKEYDNRIAEITVPWTAGEGLE